MTSNNLFDFTHKYHEVRGWRTRRIYMSLKDLVELRLSEPRAELDNQINFMFDGAAIYPVRSATVAALIREWDLQP